MGTVTTDTSNLTTAKGFWSKRDIYINTSQDVVLLKPETVTSEVICIIREFIDDHLNEWVIKEAHKATLKVIKALKSKNTKRGYSGYYIEHGILLSGIKSPNKPEWIEAAMSASLSISSRLSGVVRQGLTSEQISEDLTEAWLLVHRPKPYNGLCVSTMRSCSLALVPWDTLQYTQTVELLNDLWELSNINISPKRFDLKSNKPHNNKTSGEVTLKGLTANEQRLFTFYCGNPIDSIPLSGLRIHLNTIISAAKRVLLLLVQKEVCLLPYGSAIPTDIDFIGLAKSVLGQDLINSLFKKGDYRSQAASLLGSSTMKSTEDFPVGLGEHLLVEIQGTELCSAFKFFLKDYALKNNVDEYPYKDLTRWKQAEHPMFSPQWIKQNYSQEWYDFTFAYWQQSDACDQEKSSAISNLCRWACDLRNFKSPYDIQPTDLRNPFMETEMPSFYEYVRDGDFGNQHRARKWQHGTKLYTYAANAAKLPGSPVYSRDVKNPFEGIENPFNKDRSGTKTQRPRMPQTLVEAMVETVLDPDEDGVSTYRWVKEITKTSDNAYVQDPDDPSSVIQVWCPSTANCLLTILLTPIRAHQSRWLDQGLMDKFIFDLHTGEMVKNLHPLANWKYPNGKTHKEQYGGLSGVFQTEYDSMSDKDEFIFWIDTNKTKMWDPTQKRGYPMPWPTGEDLMKSEDEAIRIAGVWLNRAFKVLKYQIEWMQRYDPNPHPVSFEHDTLDKRKINSAPEYLAQYPWFTPLFRNLSSSFKDERNGKQVNIHPPVSWQKIENLFGTVAIETERRLRESCGQSISLTRVASYGTFCKYRPHDLRVAGISSLLEMGVPIHVVQYLVGHAAVAMTFGYAKFETPWIKEQIISAIKKRVYDVGGFDRAYQLLKEGKISPQDLLVFPKRNGDTQVGKIAEDLTAYIPLNGGLCRMGGPDSGSCQVGRLYTKVFETGRHAGEEFEEYGITGGICALCRFWATGPLFLQEQEYVGNLTILKLSDLCRRRKKLYDRHNDLAIAIDESPVGDDKHRLQQERLRIADEIINLSAEISTVNLEIAARAELFEESEKRLTQLQKILAENPAANINQFELITGPIGKDHDFKAEIAETSELGLVRRIIERFRFIERKVVAIPETAVMRGTEFTDLLLEAIDFYGGHLFQIRNHENRAFSASLLLNFFSYAADPVNGDVILQDVIDGKRSLNMIEEKKEMLRQLAGLVISTAKTENAIDWEKMGRDGGELFAQIQNGTLPAITESGPQVMDRQEIIEI